MDLDPLGPASAMIALAEILTIGVYGWTTDRFVAALKDADCDLLVDVRARRGVRGREHAFANSTRLQSLLSQAGIGYLHVPELAPSPGIRAAQHRADEGAGSTKRGRVTLSTAFVDLYRSGILDQLDPEIMIARLGEHGRPALLRVEGRASACHRSLAAAWLGARRGLPVIDLEPSRNHPPTRAMVPSTAVRSPSTTRSWSAVGARAWSCVTGSMPRA